MKTEKDGNHYELLEPVQEVNINHLLKWLESIEEDDCFVHLEGNSYHFISRESRQCFVLGIDFVFGQWSVKKPESSDETV